MRISTTNMAVALGLAGALALSAANPSLARTKHHRKHAHSVQATEAHAPASAHASANPMQYDANGPGAFLPGYSERPNGWCWYRQGGGGQDLSGDWEPCK